jgi:hypothetical protein
VLRDSSRNARRIAPESRIDFAEAATIAEASRQSLSELREKTGEQRLKIIASALKMKPRQSALALKPSQIPNSTA